MKKGFTLIELLSVIVILAIISLIAIPSLTKVVSNVKLKADLESVRGYINAADTYYMKAQYDSDLYDTLGTNVIDKLPVKGEKLTGSVIINTDGSVEVAIIKNNKCYKKDKNDSDNEIKIFEESKCEVEDKEPVLYTLSREDMLNAKSNMYPSNAVLKYEKFKKLSRDTYDGTIPIKRLDDPVYLSMTMPSETMSDYTTQQGRDNAHIIGDVNADETKRTLAIGAFYKTTGATLPETFSIYFGKIKLFAYSKSQKKWIILDERKHLSKNAVYIYKLPWTNNGTTKLTDVEETDDYLKVNVTAEQFGNNVIHFWGSSAPIDKDDYLYYAAAYEFWVSDNVAGKLTAVNAIDAKDEKGTATTSQLYSSRGWAASTTKKITWGHTVPSDQYDKVNTKILNQMF